MAAGNFETCLKHVLVHEGGYADHPQDPGGATNRGITRKTLALWRGVSPWWDLPKTEMKALDMTEASAIYRALYWKTCIGAALPDGLDLAVFDFAVNSGPARAVKGLQALLGVTADGVAGPITLGAIRAAEARGETAALIRALCAARLSFLSHLKTFATFGRGWTRRVAAIEAAAIAMRPADENPLPTSKGRHVMDILNGYKTYIIGAMMIASALAQLAGIDLPGLEGQSAGQLLMEAFAIIFLRKGLKSEIGNA